MTPQSQWHTAQQTVNGQFVSCTKVHSQRDKWVLTSSHAVSQAASLGWDCVFAEERAPFHFCALFENENDCL